MELDEMKNAWLTLDRRLERQEALHVEAFRNRQVDKLEAALRPLWAGQIVQIIVGVLLTFVFAPFWVEHRDTPHLLITGLSLHAYALMLIVFAARDLYMIQSIDYAAPVLAIQRRLADLRTWRVRVAPVFGAVGCLVWVPLLLWLFEVAFGVDLYALHPQVVYVFIASGLACFGLMMLLMRWLRNPHRARFAKVLEDSAAGRGIAKAQRFVDEVATFARDA